MVEATQDPPAEDLPAYEETDQASDASLDERRKLPMPALETETFIPESLIKMEMFD